MIKVIQTILLSLLVAGQVNFAYAQTASILPNAKTTFLDNNGKPLVGGTVQFYIPGTTTTKTTWQDSGETIPNANPVILDAAGRAIILGDGSYRQQVFDRLGNLIWDQQTSSTGSGGGGTTPTVGDGSLVGTIKEWSGFTAPSQYVFSYGQELARASFPLLFSTLTSQQNVSCTSGSAVLTGVGDTSQIPTGAPIESICLNSGATVVSTTISTVTASSNAIISTSSSARFFPFGNGDGSATFNTPDLRGRVLAGRDNMGGIAASRLTQTYYQNNAEALGAPGGGQNHTLLTANLPSYTPAGSFPGGTYAGTGTATNGQGSTFASPNPPGSPNAATFSGGTSSGGSLATSVSTTIPATALSMAPQGGTSAPYISIQPSMTINYIIKTLPDTNANSFFGVASIGGMFGVITCGFGITCSGNNISAVTSTVPPPTLTTLGGVFQINGPSNQFATGVDNTGTFQFAQPTFTNLSGSIAAGQIPNNLISNAMLRQSVALSLIGRSANSNGNVADISATAGSSCAFIESGSTLVCGQLVTAGIANLAVTGAKMANNTVTNTQLAQANATTLKANPTGSLANEQDVTLGSTLNFSGTTLNCTTGASAQLGCVRPDNTTITASAGVLTAVGAAATSIADGTTTISSGVSTSYLFNASGTLSHVLPATKSVQQTATDATAVVTPAQQQSHPSAEKAWISLTGSTGAGLTSYNINATTHPTTGQWTATFTTAFASANYVCSVTPVSSTTPLVGQTFSKTATVVTFQVTTLAGALNDATQVDLKCAGTQ